MEIPSGFSYSLLAAGQRLRLLALSVAETELLIAAGRDTVSVETPCGSVRLVRDDAHLIFQSERLIAARDTRRGDEQNVG
jgi:hypothetical protein